MRISDAHMAWGWAITLSFLLFKVAVAQSVVKLQSWKERVLPSIMITRLMKFVGFFAATAIIAWLVAIVATPVVQPF